MVMKSFFKCSIVCVVLFMGTTLWSSENPLANATPPAPQPACPFPSGTPIFGRPLGIDYLKIIPYGYVKWEMYFDSRQNVGTRENQLIFFPQPIIRDKFGQDINDRGHWHMTAIESRFGIVMIGPKWDCITTEGAIEGDFRGPTDATISCFRLRHAFGIVKWKTGSFLFGQYWHPLFVPVCYPHTVAFSIGAPMEPQARAPQLRITQRWDWLEFIGAVSSQRDFQSTGPNGLSTEYIRNAITPNVTVELRAYGENFICGAVFDYLRLVPRLVSDLNISVCEQIPSYTVEAYLAVKFAPCSARMKGFWAENGTEQLLISGYGIRSIDPVTHRQTYSNTAAVGGWLDFSYTFHCDRMELGVFVGGTKNLGSRHRLHLDPDTNQPVVFALAGVAQNIDYVVRISPRYFYAKDPVRFGIELEWTRASYGTLTPCAKVINGVPVNNYRLLTALYYVF